MYARSVMRGEIQVDTKDTNAKNDNAGSSLAAVKAAASPARKNSHPLCCGRSSTSSASGSKVFFQMRMSAQIVTSAQTAAGR